MLDFTGVKAITIPEGKVKKITRKSDGVVLWEKVTGRIPSAYQEVEWIQAAANVGAYINLGFSYDTGATIHLGQYIMNDNTAYPFGAVSIDDKFRCALSFPYGNAATAYFSYNSYAHQATVVRYTKNILNEFVAQYKVGDFVLKNLTLGTEQKYNSMISYTMTDSLYLFAQNYRGNARFGDIRRIAYFKYYDKTNTLICDLVPCYRKSDGVIGMYDLVKKTFFTNVGTGSFTKGADVQPSYTNLADPTSAEWKTNKRINSSGKEVDVALSGKTMVMTNLIDITGATNDTKYHIKGLDLLEVNVTSGLNRVYFYDENKTYKTYWTPAGNYVSQYLQVSDYDENVQILTKIQQLMRNIPKLSGVAVKYIVFGAIITGKAEDVIITKNEEITP